MTHRLDPLLRPRSVAVVGASDNNDSLGEWSLKNLLRGGFGGPIYPINPRYGEVQGVKCFAGLAALPEVPDLVIFAVGDHRIEAALDDALDAGVPAAVVMSALYIDDDTAPQLRERVQEKIVCGANGMGFYNVRDRVWACGFDSSDHEGPGSVALISHSGSGMSGLIDCDERLRINVAVSTGNELSVTMADYLDFLKTVWDEWEASDEEGANARPPRWGARGPDDSGPPSARTCNRAAPRTDVRSATHDSTRNRILPLARMLT